MRRFIKQARLFADTTASDSAEFALQVESVRTKLNSTEKAGIHVGHRNYLSTTTACSNLAILLGQLGKQIAGLDDDERMPFALRDIGYSDNCRHRIEQQHLKHSSSNAQMTLFEAISCADHTLRGKYRLCGHIIFLCLMQEHAKYGEIIFSLLAQSYVQTGRGFNGTMAGKSVASSKKYEKEDWDAWRKAAVREGLIKRNMQAEKIASRISVRLRKLSKKRLLSAKRNARNS